jgi:hypothetical protein
MKVCLDTLNEEEFLIRKFIVAGEEVSLVNPALTKVGWNKDNLIFRSSIWNAAGEPVSLSFPKFFNLKEHPGLSPTIEPPFTVMEKLDGSTLIVSKYKGELILRTRGSVNAKLMPNGSELDYFQERYSKFFSSLSAEVTVPYSYIFEWVSPKNKIVLEYLEPEIFLTAIISHADYSLLPQRQVEDYAASFGLKRPITYSFNNLEETISEVTKDDSMEGVCIYHHNDQEIRKCKSFKYLKLHALKSSLNLKAVLELYLTLGEPEEDLFLELLGKQFDFECAVEIKKILQSSCLYAKVKEKREEFEEIRQWSLRYTEVGQKEFAQEVKKRWSGYQMSLCFLYRRGQSVDKIVKEQILEIAKLS